MRVNNSSTTERLNWRRELLALLIGYTVLSAFLMFPNTLSAQGKQDSKGQIVRPVNQLPSREKRWALIIGVDIYEDGNISPLRGATNDAKELARALQKYAGFDESQIVVLTTDAPRERQPTRANILRRLSNLKNLVPKDGLLLVSFSGHGIERSGRAFLIPMDATATEDVDLLEETAVSVDRMKRQVKATGVQQVLFLLDACRNDPTSGKAETINPLTEAYKRGFSFDVRNREVEAFATFYATSIGARAYEYAEKRQGYFSWAIVEALSGKAANSKGEVTLNSLVKYVEERVPKQVQLDLGTKIQKPFVDIYGYKADELVLSIGNAEPLSPLIKTTTFKQIAGNLLQYDEVDSFSESLAKVQVVDRPIIKIKYGFIDETGKEVVPAKYEDVQRFSSGLAAVKLNDKWGFIDKTGKVVIALKYDAVKGAFNEGLRGVKLNDKWGYINTADKEVVPFIYDEVDDFSEGLAKVKLNSKWGFIDKAGKVIIPFEYDDAYNFTEGLASVKLGDEETGKYGYIDKTGKIVIPMQYKNAWFFRDGIAPITLGDGSASFKLEEKYGFINKAGKIIIPLKYGVIGYREGLYLVTLNRKWGFINKDGMEVIPPKYDDAWFLFHEGLAEVQMTRKRGFIDKTGKEVIPLKYDDVWCEAFQKDGIIGVWLNGKKGFVDIYGNEYFDFQ